MKLAVIYHSESGNTKKIAELIADGATDAGEVETRLMSVAAVDGAFVAAADAVIFGCPTYYGTYSWQIKQWFDTTKIKLAGKLGSAFATANNIGGGAEVAELGLVGMMLVRGMLVYSAGVAKGMPLTHFGAVVIKDGDEAQQQRAKLLGQRVAEKAIELFGGK